MTKITLDRVALKALIDADPDFELELKNAVLAEVGRRFFEKDAKRVIAAAEPELFAQALKGIQEDADVMGKVKLALESAITTRSKEWPGRLQLSPDVKNSLDEAVAATKQKAIYEAQRLAEEAFSTMVKDSVERTLAIANIEERIDKRVSRLADEEIERRAREHFNKLKAKIESALS